MEKFSQNANLATRAFEIIRSEITSGRLPAGSLVSASSLADRFGISRTPVRDALLQLSQAGMVRIEKNRGAVVLATSLEDLIEVFQIRLMLEVPLAGRAAELRTEAQVARIQECFSSMQDAANSAEMLLVLDRDLHILIAEVGGNKRTIAVLTDLRNLVLTRGVGTTSTARTGQELVDDHALLVEAIVLGNPETAAAEMRRHIVNTAYLLIAQESNGDAAYDESWVAERLGWLS